MLSVLKGRPEKGFHEIKEEDESNLTNSLKTDTEFLVSVSSKWEESKENAFLGSPRDS